MGRRQLGVWGVWGAKSDLRVGFVYGNATAVVVVVVVFVFVEVLELSFGFVGKVFAANSVKILVANLGSKIPGANLGSEFGGVYFNVCI